MRLVQLAYASACVGRLQLNTIENILSKAVEKNRALGITVFRTGTSILSIRLLW